MKKTSKTLRRTLLVAVAAVFLTFSFPIDAFADPYIYGTSQQPNCVDSSDIDAIHEDLDIEARAQVIWNTLKKCVKGSYEERDTDFNPADIPDDDDFFDYSRDVRGVVAVSTGYWLENKVQGNGGDDGAIYCRQGNNKILFLAADVMNEALQKHGESFDYKMILCNGTDDGIIHYRKGNHRCNPTHDTDNYEFASGWNTHLKNLWDHARDVAGWAKDWSLIGNFGADNGRILYEREAGTRCGSQASVAGGNALGYAETASQKPSGYYFDPALEIVGQDGGQAFEYFSENNEIEEEFVDRDDIDDCVDLITRANSDTIVDNFRAKVFATFNDRCRNFYQNIVDTDSNVSDDTKSEFKAIKDADDAAIAARPQNTGLDRSSYKFLQDKDDPNDPTDTLDMECIDIDGLLHPEQADDQSYADDASQELNEQDPDCYTNAGSLGWVLCPIIDQGGKFVTMIYEKMIEPFLVLDSGLFTRGTTGGDATYDAWTQFQTYANVVFIAMFLFVIFSQLTGYGIDNYGIKKILPKLIVAAILINLSYIICQAAVDIANILGYGMKSILDGIGTVKIDTMTLAETPNSHPVMAAGATAILVGLVALITIPAILSQGTAILVPVFIAIIGIVIAVFTLFCLLAVRKAFAVVLVVISPMAFVCYMLPNTKKLFDKWFTAFKGTLLAFPICSAMVYGGQAVARILVQASGGTNMPFLVVLSAAVMSIAPVFLIPGTLKKSMGAISGFINGASNRLSHAAKGRAMNSRGMRYLKHQGDQRMMARQGEYNRRRAARTVGRFTDKNGKVDYGKMSASQRRSFDIAQNTLAAHDMEMKRGYASQLENADKSDAVSLLHGAVSGKSVDMNAASVAIDKLGKLDQGEMLEELEKFTSTEAFRNMSTVDRNKFINTLASQSGNTVAKAYAKVLNSNPTMSLKEAMSGSRGGLIGEKIRDMDDQTIQNTDKDVLRYMSGGRQMGHDGEEYAANSAGLADAFSNSQVANAMTSESMSGKMKDNFNKVIDQRDSGLLGVDVKAIKNTEQFTKADDSMLSKVESKIGSEKMEEFYKKHMDELTASGNEQALLKVSDYKKKKYESVTKTPPATA